MAPASVSTSGPWAGISRLILGSKSWSRRTLLSELDVCPFEILNPDIDESLIRRRDPRHHVLDLAHAKARALLARGIRPAEHGKTLLICGDAVVTHKGRILGKPNDVAEARQFLQSYATAPATTVASIVVVDVQSGFCWQGCDEAEVYFRPLPDPLIEELVNSGGALQSAGALRIEHPKVAQYIDYIIGHKSAVMGFSQPLLLRLLEKARAAEGGDPFV